MTDPCSIWAYEEILEEGRVGELQAKVLSEITRVYPRTIIMDDIIRGVRQRFEPMIRSASVTPRLAELEDMGFIIKSELVTNAETNKTVNAWKWSEKKSKLDSHYVEGVCPRCKGDGKIQRKVYIS